MDSAKNIGYSNIKTMTYNYKFAKPDPDGHPIYGPMPLGVDVLHHDEWEDPVIDPETGRPTGETEHKVSDWREKRTVIHPTSADFASMGYLPLVDRRPFAAPEGKHWVRMATIEPDNGTQYRWKYVLNDNPPAPPRKWSRRSLKMALADADVLSAVKVILSNMEIAPEYTAWEALSDDNHIEEGYPDAARWSALLDRVAEGLGKSRQEIDAFLDKIPTEGKETNI